MLFNVQILKKKQATSLPYDDAHRAFCHRQQLGFVVTATILQWQHWRCKWDVVLPSG